MPPSKNSGPTFGKAASYISDVQLRHTLSPDAKANAILFDNFTLRLAPGGAEIVTRALSIAYPLAGITAATPLKFSVRGNLTIADGGSAGASLVCRVLGKTHVIDPQPSRKTRSGNFAETLNLLVQPGDSLNIVLLPMLEQARTPGVEALLSIDAIDMAFE
jgi:hypothetical protein